MRGDRILMSVILGVSLVAAVASIATLWEVHEKLKTSIQEAAP